MKLVYLTIMCRNVKAAASIRLDIITLNTVYIACQGNHLVTFPASGIPQAPDSNNR